MKNNQFGFDVKWTNNANRISSIFVKEHERRITIQSIGEKISFNLREDESFEEIRKRIGCLLASQSIGQTYEILKSFL